MKNKNIDNMLNTLTKHSPNWIDKIRVYINKLEYDLLAYRRPIGKSVVNVRLQAKKEVFDDIKKILENNKEKGYLKLAIENYISSHLSTFSKEKGT